MMKKILIVSLIIGCISFKKEDDSINLYIQSLRLYLSDIKTDTIYVMKCFDIKLPAKLGKFNVIDIENSRQNIIKEKGALYAIKIMPIKLRNEIVEIGLTEYFVKEENNDRIMSNSGSEIFSYRYDKSSHRYKLIKRTKNAF
jgi:hypothetical protein